MPEHASINADKDFKQLPAFVENVVFDGIQRTKDDVFEKATRVLRKSTNMHDLLQNLVLTQNELGRIGIAKDVRCELEVGKSEFGYDVMFKLKEVGRMAGGMHTTVGNAEGRVALTANLPNVFGRGEKIIIDTGCGSRTRVDWNISFVKPVIMSNTLEWDVNAFRRSVVRDEIGLKSSEYGLNVGVRRCLGDFTSQKLTFEPLIRYVTSIDQNTPLELRQQSGWFSKHAVIHEICRDTRTDPILPNSGTLLRLSNELSAGSVPHLRTDFAGQLNIPIPFLRKLAPSIQFSANAGYLQSLKSGSDIPIDSKFFLGGPLLLRGFYPFRAGPHVKGTDRAYPTGGNAYFCLGSHLYTRIPGINPTSTLFKAVKFHAFANAGSVYNTSHIPTPSDFRQQALRATAGLGLAITFAGAARLEINFIKPLKVGPSDRMDARKVQFMFGVEYS